jgi:hypothetical protein
VAATIELECGSCGQRHTLFLPVADLYTAGAEYAYVCPQKRNLILFTVGDKSGNANVQMRPRNSIVVREISK